MPSYTLRMTVPSVIPKTRARTTFYWTPSGAGSFVRSFGPRLGALGPVAEPNIEFARLAATVYAADRSTPRAGDGSNWSQREFELTVPVWKPSRWEPVADRLGQLLGFLSGDAWDLEFVTARTPAEPIADPPATPPDRVLLLSGGADSAVGALVSRHQLGDEPHALVSHFAATFLPSVQKAIVEEITGLLPGPAQEHHVIHFGRHERQPNGAKFDDEFSTRARSLLFIAFGLAVASRNEVPLWVSENGFASLNPPLGPDRLGSLSTRTTHPYFLETLQTLLRAAGAHAEITNPFQGMTKGEMFTQAAEIVGAPAASKLLGSTLSCAHTGHRALGYPLKTGCGVCFGCLVRKSAFAAAGLHDPSPYLPSSEPKLSRYLSGKSVERALELFTENGIALSDVAAMTLPPSYSPRAAFELCQRATAELGLLFA
jgi:7-cyano-7-deazaguanine synthase in queuosine biosynthesis